MSTISNYYLNNISKKIRIDIVKSLFYAKSGHLGGCLSLTDILTTLYFAIMNHDPKNPKWELRNRLILSNGHTAPALYVTLAHANYFDIKKIYTLRKLNSPLQGHPSLLHHLPGIESSSGSLGQGLSIAIGIALALKINNIDSKTYVILGDGELNEGQIWKAAMAATHHNLNITAIIDKNNLQIDGKTSEVMNTEPLTEKWKSFGWKTHNINGHSFPQLTKTLQNNKLYKSPTVIIANTIMGKGIKSIENNHLWHGKVPSSKKELNQFIEQINNNC